jgi:ubiquitin-protein ligase
MHTHTHAHTRVHAQTQTRTAHPACSSDSDGDELDEVPAATQLARSFLATHAALNQRASDQPGRMEESGGFATVSYEEALRPLKLCTARVAATDHDYLRELESIPLRSKMSRLAQELADANSGLPCMQGNAIFLRVDKQRVDLMQVLITGVSGTPYALGCFVFDVYCPADYPSVAPKVNLRTTGAGQLRFNPNLYANGKVCLSLLGTWRGSAAESWTPDSTLLQVFISIQSLIMTDDVYFNEPGFEHVRSSPEGPRLNRAYSNIVRYGTVRYAMVDQLRNKDSLFADAIK